MANRPLRRAALLVRTSSRLHGRLQAASSTLLSLVLVMEDIEMATVDDGSGKTTGQRPAPPERLQAARMGCSGPKNQLCKRAQREQASTSGEQQQGMAAAVFG